MTSAGDIVCLELDLFSNGGCSLELSGAVMNRALHHIDNAYKIKNLRATGKSNEFVFNI